MDNVVKYFGTIESSFKKMKFLTVASVLMGVLVALGSVVYSFTFMASHSDNIYILDRDKAYSATIAGAEEINRGLEAEGHVRRFHELMFNLFPSRESITRNLEQALHLSDQSAYDYYKDQQENEFYTRLIQENISQYISIDSVRVDMSRLPYQEQTYGTLYMLRRSNITSYDFVSTGQLIEVGRSKDNPNGFLLEQFMVRRLERKETRKRSL